MTMGIHVVDADTQALWICSTTAGCTTASSGIAFGEFRDTNLYRSAANTLSTDDSVVIAQDLTVDTDTLVVDSTNNRVGVGTAPSYKFEVSDGTLAVTGTLSAQKRSTVC